MEETIDKEKSLIDHLEDLRRHLLKAAVGVLISLAICAYFSDWIIDNIILSPIKTAQLQLINTIPYGQITMYMSVVLFSSLVLSSPIILFQLWKFIVPALFSKEKKYFSKIVFFTTLCFLLGIGFSYFILVPYMLKFFATFGSPNIQNMISVSEYISFLLEIVLISGLVFELPMVAYFLSKVGILTPEFMKHYRRHSIVVIFILSALITPTTDPFTMIIFSLPMILLYEISIWVSKITNNKTT